MRLQHFALYRLHRCPLGWYPLIDYQAHRVRLLPSCAFRELSLQIYLVHVAPAPVFARLERLDDGMAGRVEVFGGVPILRVVAAADMAADQALTQVDPGVAHLQALLATVATRRHVANLIQVSAMRNHAILLAGTSLCVFPHWDIIVRRVALAFTRCEA